MSDRMVGAQSARKQYLCATRDARCAVSATGAQWPMPCGALMKRCQQHEL